MIIKFIEKKNNITIFILILLFIESYNFFSFLISKKSFPFKKINFIIKFIIMQHKLDNIILDIFNDALISPLCT